MARRGLGEDKLSQLGEFGLIELIRKQSRCSESVIKGIGDDSAVVSCPSQRLLLLTTDMLIEGIHFSRDVSPQRIGYKALACNISDVAAMGGWPKYALVSLGISPQEKQIFVKMLYRGMNQLARKFDISIIGGDTVKNDRLIINIFLMGEVKRKDLIFRNGAQKGDQIFVTGPLGNSLKSGHHLDFVPRLRESQILVKKFKPTSMIDISDGLAADLGHILKASRVGAILYEELLPRRNQASLENVLYDGEDFELIFTLSSKQSLLLEKLRPPGIKFYRIGEVTAGRQELVLVDSEGLRSRIEIKGFTHF